MLRRLTAKGCLGLFAGVAAVAFAGLAATASAHGLVTRYDLPIPEWLFAWAAAVVLIVSFALLAVLWQEPRLSRDAWRPLPRGISRSLTHPAFEVLCGGIGVFLFYVVIWSGLAGFQGAGDNFSLSFVFITFWVGLVPVSVLFGDVFRAFNPWRAIARTVAWVATGIAARPLRARFQYPTWLGRWPAALGLMGFVWLEIVSADGDSPRTLAIATLVYSAITLVAMALYGIETWTERGEAFSVYFNLFSRISPFERRGNEIGLRPPLAGLAEMEPLPGTVPLLAVMIGTVSFDGFSGGETWQSIYRDVNEIPLDLGLGPQAATEVTYTVGLVVAVLIAYAFYRLGIAGAATVGSGMTSRRLAAAFVPSLVPIALAYVGAHYVSYLLLQGQDIAALSSDPLGRGWDLFGTATWKVNYQLVSANTIWYLQVGLVVAGHVAALTLAHEKALTLYSRSKDATRSQYWMLVVMVGFTTLALWLLSEQNKG